MSWLLCVSGACVCVRVCGVATRVERERSFVIVTAWLLVNLPSAAPLCLHASQPASAAASQARWFRISRGGVCTRGFGPCRLPGSLTLTRPQPHVSVSNVRAIMSLPAGQARTCTVFASFRPSVGKHEHCLAVVWLCSLLAQRSAQLVLILLLASSHIGRTGSFKVNARACLNVTLTLLAYVTYRTVLDRTHSSHCSHARSLPSRTAPCSIK